MSSHPAPRRSRPVLIALIVAFLATLAACGGGSDDDVAGRNTTDGDGTASTPGTDESPIRIGFEGPLSGDLAFLGSNQLAGLQASVDAINDAGGVDGRSLEVVAEDDGGDATKAVAAVRSLASQGVVAIMANPVSSVLEAIVPVAQEVEVPLVSAGSSQELLVPARPYFFGLDIPPAAESTTQLEFATRLLDDDAVTVGLIGSDTPATEEWAGLVGDLAEAQGETVTTFEKVGVAAADVTTQAQAVIAGSPDAVLANVSEASLALVATRIRQLGYEGPIVNYHGGGAPKFLAEHDDPELYVARTTAALTDPTDASPGVERFVDATEAAGAVATSEANPLYGIGYLAGLVVEAALADGSDAAAVHEALSDFELDTEGFTFAPVTYGADDHQGLDTVAFYHWVDGALVTALDGATFTGQLPLGSR